MTLEKAVRHVAGYRLRGGSASSGRSGGAERMGFGGREAPQPPDLSMWPSFRAIASASRRRALIRSAGTPAQPGMSPFDLGDNALTRSGAIALAVFPAVMVLGGAPIWAILAVRRGVADARGTSTRSAGRRMVVNVSRPLDLAPSHVPPRFSCSVYPHGNGVG